MNVRRGFAVLALVAASFVTCAGVVCADDSTETCCGPPTETPPPTVEGPDGK